MLTRSAGITDRSLRTSSRTSLRSSIVELRNIRRSIVCGHAWCPRFTSFFWTLTQAEEDPGWAAEHLQLAISGRPLRFDLHHSVLAESIMPEATPLPVS